MTKAKRILFTVLCVMILACAMSISAVANTVTNEASVNDTEYATLEIALENAQAGDTVTLLTDVTATNILVVDKGITIDGNNKTITSSAKRAINVSGANGVVIKNLTINASGERGINVIQGATNVTLENVSITAANYAVNVAGSASGAVLTVKDSYLKGLSVFNVAGTNVVATIENTAIYCDDKSSAENYGAICLAIGSDGSKVTVIDCEFTVTDDSEKIIVVPADAEVIVENTDAEVVHSAVKVGNYTMSTLEEAVQWIASTGKAYTITLLDNVVLQETLVIPQGTKIVLDLNGKSITVAEKASEEDKYICAIDNSGDLTIKDSVGEGSISTSSIKNNGKLTIENGTFIGLEYGNDYPLIGNYAELVINGGYFDGRTNAVRTYSTGVTEINGGEILSVNSYAIVNAGFTTINYAEITRGFGGVNCLSGGKLVINDGQIWPNGGGYTGYTCHVVYANSGSEIVINGGTFKMNYSTGVPDSGSAVTSYYGATLTITGGTFISHFDSVSPVELSAGAVITGGTYLTHSGAPSTHSYVKKYIADGYKLNGSGEVVEIALEEAYTFVGYSYSETSQGIILGYTVDGTVLEKIGYKDIGSSFTVVGAETVLNTSFEGRVITSSYDVKITGISEAMADIEFVMALYVIDKNGIKQYLTENGTTTNIEKVTSATVNGLK